MNRTIAAVGVMACLLLASGCAKKETTAAPGASPSASPAPLPFHKAVDIAFNDVAVTTAGAPLLRLGFTVHDTSKDPVQCDPSEFAITLSDGTVIQADQSAENKCTPDALDPGASADAVMFFVLKSGYSGPITLSMTGNDAIVGKADTTVK